MKREQLGSRFGFIMLSAGCAIGCGNVWKFPWMCGQNGGGSFMLVYILCLIILGIPALTMEFSIGRAAQASPLYMYRKLQKPGQKWGGFGWMCFAGNLALMAFYTVVCGWLIYYFCKFLTGGNESLGFASMIYLPSGHCPDCLYCSLIQSPGWSGADYQDSDVSAARFNACARYPQPSFAGSRRWYALLPETGFFQN